MPKPIPQRLSANLPVTDSARAAEARSRIGVDAFAPWGEAGGRFLDAVFSAAPYLERLAARRPETVRACAVQSPESLAEAACLAAKIAGAEAASEAALVKALRLAKGDLHLVAALADLSGAWTMRESTGALSAFADAATRGALHGLVRLDADRLGAPESGDNPAPGLFVLALGKLGADELNFSSDIDLAVFFDPEGLRLPEGQAPQKRLPRLVQALARVLQETTADGYVFRVDLRLRPDPGASPVAMSADAALNYYESLGQNWERAAYIKARYCAGDPAAAADFLAALTPFIWRRSLDFAAVDDIRSLARQIQAVGRRAEIRAGGHDLKLGRGGIREIEFYAQVPQLVFGGRSPGLRLRSPAAALKALAAAGKIEAGAAEALDADYRFLRDVEHRIQMIEDQPTQTLPEDDPTRARVAALAGSADLGRFDADVEAALRRVHAHFSEQFAGEDTLASGAGSLVFTGVEPTPDTLATLGRLGFLKPEDVWSRLHAWSAGRARSTRTPRARALLTRLAPRLLEAMGETGEPDAAFARFAAFFEGLPMGVQPLSLLVNEPQLADELVAILGLAPRMAEILARRPAILDVMLDARFSRPLSDDPPGEIAERMAAQMIAAVDFEDRMNRARRFAREERFRIGAQILRGRADADIAGRAYADLADACVSAMAEAAAAEMQDRYGPAPGRFVILGLGKLGGRELAADSDLDVMLVYEPDAGVDAAPETYFTRLTQRFVSALSAPTQEGGLYEADMQLRPSGKAGPVAVRMARFRAYYREDAWTWELMAMTRARPVAGDEALAASVQEAIQDALAVRRSAGGIRADAAAMRARLARDKGFSGPWDLKLRPGGLVDIEFIAQALQLVAPAAPDGMHASTAGALTALTAAGVIKPVDAETLAEAARFYLHLSQLIRTAHGAGFDPVQASRGFARLLAETGGAPDMAVLQARIEVRADAVRALFETLVGQWEAAATDSRPLAR